MEVGTEVMEHMAAGEAQGRGGRGAWARRRRAQSWVAREVDGGRGRRDNEEIERKKRKVKNEEIGRNKRIK